jgi:hypothetical protein
MTVMIYLGIAVIDYFIELQTMAIVLAVSAVLLAFIHSRIIAIGLLTLVVVDFILNFSLAAHVGNILTAIQIGITIRAVEATFKLRQPKFQAPPSHVHGTWPY